MGRNHNWIAADDALLGKLPDPEVARRLGITKLRVLKRRKKLGISAAKLRAPVKPVLRCAMRAPLPKDLAEKPVRDLTADEYLAAAQRISQFQRRTE